MTDTQITPKEVSVTAAPVAPVMSANDVHKWFGKNEVLRGVSLDVSEGEVVAILGPSGSGKTTFLRCINYLETYDSGSIHLDGELVGYEISRNRVYARREADIARMRARTGMVFQQFNLFPQMTALENVSYGPRRVLDQPKGDANERAAELLRRVGLGHRMDLLPSGLSGGQQQRVGIARALAMDPRLLLLDEPTSALDPELVGEVLDVVRKVAAGGMTMIIVTHEIRFARQVADKVVVMDNGIVVDAGSPQEVLDNARVDRVRQFLARETQHQDAPPPAAG